MSVRSKSSIARDRRAAARAFGAIEGQGLVDGSSREIRAASLQLAFEGVRKELNWVLFILATDLPGQATRPGKGERQGVGGGRASFRRVLRVCRASRGMRFRVGRRRGGDGVAGFRLSFLFVVSLFGERP